MFGIPKRWHYREFQETTIEVKSKRMSTDQKERKLTFVVAEMGPMQSEVNVSLTLRFTEEDDECSKNLIDETRILKVRGNETGTFTVPAVSGILAMWRFLDQCGTALGNGLSLQPHFYVCIHIL